MHSARTIGSHVFAVVALACAVASWNWQFFLSIAGQRYADVLVLALSIFATIGGLVSFFISRERFARVISVMAILVSTPIWLLFAYLLANPSLYVSH